MGRYEGYEKYKDSGVEWLGVIPVAWSIMLLKRGVELLTDYEANGSFADVKENVLIDTEERYAWYLRATDLEKNRYGLEENNRTCDQKTYNFLSKTKLFGGEFLVAKRGEIGKVYVVPYLTSPATLAPNLYLIRLNKKLLPKYVYYWFESSVGKPQLELVNKSTTIGALYKDDVKSCLTLYPPLDEQESIAHFLDRKTTQIDILIAKKTALLEKLDEKRTALISHAVTKGLHSSVPMKDSGVEWLGDIPKSWRRGKLNYFCKIISGGTPDRGNPDFWEGDIPWIKTGEVNYQDIYSAEEFITKKGLQSSAATLARSGTLLMAMYGQGKTRGRVAILKIEAAFNQACLAISPFHNLSVYFLYYYLISAYEYIRDTGNESSQMNLSSGIIGKIDILVPDLKIQQEIIEYLEEKTAEIDQQKAKVKEAIKLLKEYRTALITNAVTGKIDVRRVDQSAVELG